MVERNIPSKLVTIRLTDKPCFNSEIKKENIIHCSARIRNRLHRDRGNQFLIHHYKQNKSHSNKVNNIIKYAREDEPFFVKCK